MATNLEIDDRLLNRAKKVGGFKTKKETVNVALTEFLQSRKQRAAASLFGTIEFAEGYDYKALRAKR